MSKKWLIFVLAALCADMTFAASQQEADRLGKDLTPIGAEKAGNKDGTIPAWSGKADEALPGWAWGKERAGFSKMTKEEKPLFTITPANVDQYASKMTPGQVALVKQVPNYRMDVYPSHRNCVVPSSVEERTKMNALEAKMNADGFSLDHAKAGGVPFPIPANGAEAMWNQKLRPTGVGFTFQNGGSVLSPRRGTNDYVFYDWELTQFYPWGAKGAKNVEDSGKVELYGYYKYSAPVALVGQALVYISYLDKIAESSYYFPGQRRVRRLPAYAYDAPLIGFENEYMVDIQNMFWSTLDLFDYKLAGKKEIYIPHDAFKMYNFNTPHKDAYLKDEVNPDLGRYELHRVWVVEATVRAGMRHSAPKRTYYLDEDSWNILIAEDYDSSGKLWNVRQAWQIPVWELGGICTYNPFIQYNLQSGRYMSDYSVLGQKKDVQYFLESKENVYSSSFYTPDTLRAISER